MKLCVPIAPSLKALCNTNTSPPTADLHGTGREVLLLLLPPKALCASTGCFWRSRTGCKASALVPAVPAQVKAQKHHEFVLLQSRRGTSRDNKSSTVQTEFPATFSPFHLLSPSEAIYKVSQQQRCR